MKSSTVRPASFLDHNSGAPVSRDLWRAVESELFSSEIETARSWNPSGVHASGRRAKQVLRRARERVVRSWVDSSVLINSLLERTTFTSSGSEANQMFLRSFVLTADTPWFYAADHHDSVRSVASCLPSPGRALSVDSEGRLDLEQLAQQLNLLQAEYAHRPLPAPVFALLWVNNETGVVQDAVRIEELIFTRFPQALVLWDSVQAWGKLPLADALARASTTRSLFFSFSGHKIGAFPGIGLLVAPPGSLNLSPLIVGKQERGVRGGTESLSAITSLGLAAECLGSVQDQVKSQERMREMQREFEAHLLKSCPQLRITGLETQRAPQTTHLRVEGIRGDALLSELDLLGFEVSTGSACQAGLAEPSAVLRAMGYSNDEARSAIRVSFGRETTPEELQAFGEALEKCLRLRDNRRA